MWSKTVRSLLATVVVVGVVAGLAACSSPSAATSAPTPPRPANPELILSSTTSTRDSGLMDVLVPMFQKQTGYQLKPIYNGSGQAMALGQQGAADVLLVHAPASEVAFMQAGWGINRQLVMHNDFIIVGPPSDAAGIKGMTSAIEALKKIAAAKAAFYSRGDNSGTDQLEKSLWKTAGIAPKGQPWYFEANLGMGDLLRVTSEKAAYTITDRATYLANLKTLSLDILLQGDPPLINIYHVIQVNPEKFPSIKINAEGARAFVEFMVSTAAQQVIAGFGVDKYGQPLFFPDAGKKESDLGSQ